MQKRGEITVFLSLILVCVLSLLMGLLESARTAGARLYLQMAANSAMASVMSNYNRNLWNQYQLLFLEYESETAIKNSFENFLDYYLEQENFYPARRKTTELIRSVKMEGNGGEALENEILSYVKYRMPEVAADLAGIAADAAEAAKAGNFRNLFEVCRQVGRETRKLQKKQLAVENVLNGLRELHEKTLSAVERESKSSFKSNAKKLKKEMERFPGYVDDYEKELERLSEHRSRLTDFGSVDEGQTDDISTDVTVSAQMEQEQLAYRQVEEAAKQALLEYRKIEQQMTESCENLDMAIALIEEAENYDGADDGEESEDCEPDWDEIYEYTATIPIPNSPMQNNVDKEKAAALDRLEELFDQELLNLVLLPGIEVSNQTVSLKEIPSERAGTDSTGAENPLDRLLINEYIFLYFDSFLEQAASEGSEPAQETRGTSSEQSTKETVLCYEQEYLLCGQAGDRKNLSGTVERLLAIRGAANLLYLLSSQEMKMQADALAAAVSMGSAPVQFILSFFILTLWAFGEAVIDVRDLLAGGKVPLWKTAGTWKTGLEQLLSLEFLDAGQGGSGTGSDYKDYFRILLFLEDRQTRNFRMMDLIQWNIRRKQADFSIADCACELEIKSDILQKHIFLLKSEYIGTVTTALSY